MLKKLCCILFVITCAGKLPAQDFIALWPEKKMPNSKGLAVKDSIANERIYQVGRPGMYAYFTSKQENRGAAVIICPGGGYQRLAYQVSGIQLAKWFNTLGINAFVLNYRLPHSPDLIQRETGPLQDAQRAIRIVRANAAQWGIDPKRIGIQGSSAGGHLASLAGTVTRDVSATNDSLDTVAFQPDFMILVSPMIDMGSYAHKGSRNNLLGEHPADSTVAAYSTQNLVTTATPPCFIADAIDDKVVPPQNSLLFYQALLNKNISTSFHVFPQGGHNIALRNNPGSADLWTTLCEQWMTEMKFIQPLPAK
jgi:acetyl esterase/lipase